MRTLAATVTAIWCFFSVIWLIECVNELLRDGEASVASTAWLAGCCGMAVFYGLVVLDYGHGTDDGD